MNIFDIKIHNIKRLSDIEWIEGKVCKIAYVSPSVIIPGTSGEYWSMQCDTEIQYSLWNPANRPDRKECIWNNIGCYIPVGIYNHIFVYE
jgi:hypothetical protein